MESHLNDNQIEELLRCALDERGTARAALNGEEDTRNHIETCEICRTKLRAEERTMDQLARLRCKGPGNLGPSCPSDEVWLEIAADITNSDSEESLRHASTCDHCGPLLAQALADFRDEFTCEEELELSALASSTPAGQKGLAQALQSMATSTGNKSLGDARNLWIGITPWLARGALAALCIFLTAFGVRERSNAALSSKELVIARATILHLQQQILQGGIGTPGMVVHRTQPTIDGSAPSFDPDAFVIALDLKPGPTRGNSEMTRLYIPPQAQNVDIVTHFRVAPRGSLRGQLQTLDGKPLWTRDFKEPPTAGDSHVLHMFIPTTLFSRNDYYIVIDQTSSEFSGEIARYTIRVPQ